MSGEYVERERERILDLFFRLMSVGNFNVLPSLFPRLDTSYISIGKGKGTRSENLLMQFLRNSREAYSNKVEETIKSGTYPTS